MNNIIAFNISTFNNVTKADFRGCVKMMHPLFRYIIIVLPFFIEYDLCFSYVHAFWGYNVL